ncbi:unnamed protein product [Arctia plantaginis]|uniref:CRAL-TRIO domain-containing protein n=1 Tax=Arctia plantaginis TaxID=874455 RepID=A0A8S1AA26_ARCPL|nr:unnamed protein product [Arctia plantaginis]
MKSLTNTRLLNLPPNAVEDIKKIHNLDKPGRMDEAIDLLERWLKKQDHIIKKDFSRSYLEMTLISAKGSVEKAKKLIDRLCTMKTLLPHFFTKTNVKAELRDVLELGFVVPLPKLTEDFYRVLLIKVTDTIQFTESNILGYFQYNMILGEYLKTHDYVNGFVIVYDYQQTNILDMVTKLNPIQFQQYVSILIEGYGTRLKGIYLLTQSKAVDLIVTLVKQFLSQKISERMKVVKTLEELHQKVDKDILPVEYGGKERPTSEILADWIEELSTEENVNYLKIMNKACTNEKLRRSNEFNEEYMGMPGSFRNLTVD